MTSQIKKCAAGVCEAKNQLKAFDVYLEANRGLLRGKSSPVGLEEAQGELDRANRDLRAAIVDAHIKGVSIERINKALRQGDPQSPILSGEWEIDEMAIAIAKQGVE